MINKHNRMIIAGFCFFIATTYSSFCQGQVHLGQTHIVVYGSFGNDDISIRQSWNGDISVVIRDGAWPFSVKARREIRHNPEHRYLFVMGLDGDDEINTDTTIDQIVYGGNGSDSIRAVGESNCHVFGGNGNDDIYTNGAADCYVFGEDGDDEITLSNDGNSYAYGGDGGDDIWGYSDWNQIYGEDGDDCLVGVNRGDDFVDGGPGNDFIATGLGYDKVVAGTGSDLVYIVPGPVNQFDMGPVEAFPLPTANPDAGYFPLDKWAYWWESVYLTQLLAPLFNSEAVILPEGGYWKQG